MRTRGRILLFCLLVLSAAHGPSPSGAQAPDDGPVWVDDKYRDPGPPGWLPDTAVVVTVGERRVTARDFVEAYFNAWPPDRPAKDSLGRVQFFETLINKETLALVALKANKPLSFEDRLTIRDDTDRILSNVLFRRVVLDSVSVDTAAINQAVRMAAFEHQMRRIVLPDLAAAEKVRSDLIRKKISWKDAQARYSIAKGDPPLGDLGWQRRPLAGGGTYSRFFTLKIGEVSEPWLDPSGVHLLTIVARRPSPIEVHGGTRMQIERELRRQDTDARAERLQQSIGRGVGFAFDSANVIWAASHFNAPMQLVNGELVVDETLPEFSAADTGRVLAHYRDGRVTLGAFLQHYERINPMSRPSVNRPELLGLQVRGLALEPVMAQVARDRGLDRDPLAVGMINSRLDGIRVEHLYQDSVESRIYIEPALRKKYYDEHLRDFVTYATVRYGVFGAATKAEADSIAARLRAAGSAALVRADSLAGHPRGSIQEMKENEHGTPLFKVVFEELRPGEIRIEGPGKEGRYVVVQVVSFDPGRQLSFKESERMADESMHAIESEKRLKELLARHRRDYTITTRPERVMRIRLVDPADEV